MRAALAVAAALLGLAAAGAPPASPAPSERSARVVLRWKPVDGATSYELQVATDEKFRAVVVQERVAEPLFRWPLPTAPHWWRVRSRDAKDRPGEWSPAQQVAFEAPVPQVLAPADGARLPCGEPVTVTFAPNALVQQWTVELADTASFEGATVLRAETPAVPLGVLTPGARYLRATALDLRGRTGAASPTRRFVVGAAAPVGLRAQAAELRVGEAAQLAWAKSPCATSHQVEALPEDGPPLRLSAVEPSVRVVLPRAGVWRLRVALVDAAGQLGPWAEVSVLVELPAPASPSESPVDGGFALRWAEVPGAARYRVALSSPLAGDGGLQLDVAKPPATADALLPGTWLWSVAAVDGAGRAGRATPPRALAVAGPLPPTPPAPLDAPGWAGAPAPLADGGVELAWGAVPGAILYELERDGVSRPRSPERVDTVAVDAPRLVLRVRAVGARGELSPWSRELVLERGVAHDSPPEAGTALLSAHAGVLTNFASILFPSAVLGLAFRPALPGGWLTIGGRAGLYQVQAQANLGGVAYAAKATLLPVTLLASYVKELGSLRLRVGLGPGVQVLWLTAAGDSTLTVVPSGEALVGLGFHLGPGAVDLELAGLYGRLDAPTARLHAGGLSLRLGYTVELPRTRW